MRDIRNRKRSVGHSGNTTIFVEFRHAKLIYPDLSTDFTAGVVAHANHDILHVLQCRITHHGNTVSLLTFLLVVHHVWDGVAHARSALTLSFVASGLGIGEEREREIKVIGFRPNEEPVLLGVVVVNALGRDGEGYLVLVIILRHVRAQTDEATEFAVLQIGVNSAKHLSMHKHLQVLVLAHVV